MNPQDHVTADCDAKHAAVGPGKIYCYSNWCELARLNGEDLVDGELLLVDFPNWGATREMFIKVTVVKSRVDLGREGSITQTEAFYAADYLGVPVMVPLIGLPARRQA